MSLEFWLPFLSFFILCLLANALALSISGMRDPLFPQDALNRFFNSINGINKLPGVDNAGHFLPEWAMEYGEGLIDKYMQLREKFLLEKENNEENIDEDNLNKGYLTDNNGEKINMDSIIFVKHCRCIGVHIKIEIRIRMEKKL